MDAPVYRRRTLRKTYELPNGTINVLFPKFISELFAVSLDLKTDSVKEMISTLQGMCLAEGIKPVYNSWTDADARRERIEKEMKERGARVGQANKRREEDLKKLGADFPERAKRTRNRLGDF